MYLNKYNVDRLTTDYPDGAEVLTRFLMLMKMSKTPVCFQPQPSMRDTKVSAEARKLIAYNTADAMLRELREVICDSLSVEDDDLRERIAEELVKDICETCTSIVYTVSKLKRLRGEEVRPKGPKIQSRDGRKVIEYELLRRTEHQAVCADGVRFALKSGYEIGGAGSWSLRCLTDESLAAVREMPVGPTDVSRAYDKLYK